MQRIKNKIYEWISSMLNHNMEERRSKLTSGTPKKSLPLTDWKKAILIKYAINETRPYCHRTIFPKGI